MTEGMMDDEIAYYELNDEGMILCFNGKDELVLSVHKGFIISAYEALKDMGMN